MSKQRLLLLGIAIAAILALAVYLVVRSRGAGPLTMYGNVDIREVTLGFRVAGRLQTLNVDEGDSVHEGQVLALLDPEPLERDVAEARGNSQSLRARLQLLRTGYRIEDIAQARAALAERQAALVNAEQSYARAVELKDTGAVAARSYDSALADRDQARARVKAAQESLAQFERGYRKEEVAEAEANAVRAEAALAQAELRREDGILKAPADGVVLTRAAEAGAILAAGTPVFTVSLTRPVWARVFVDEPNLGQAAPGRLVLIYTDGRPDRPYHGQIGYVSPTAEFTPKTVETPQLRTALVYRARVVVSDADSALRQGMPVTVRLAPEGTGR